MQLIIDTGPSYQARIRQAKKAFGLLSVRGICPNLAAERTPTAVIQHQGFPTTGMAMLSGAVSHLFLLYIAYDKNKNSHRQ